MTMHGLCSERPHLLPSSLCSVANCVTGDKCIVNKLQYTVHMNMMGWRCLNTVYRAQYLSTPYPIRSCEPTSLPTTSTCSNRGTLRRELKYFQLYTKR